jgi:hypothetical protein
MFAEKFHDTPVPSQQAIYNLINDFSAMKACMICRGVEDLKLH